MANSKKPRLFSKKWLLSLTSPIRWGFIGFGLAVSLFLVEISLSLWQIYISFLGGDVMPPPEIVYWFVFVTAIASLVIGIALAMWIGWAGVYLYKYSKRDNTMEILGKLETDMGNVKKGIRRIAKLNRSKKQ